MLESLLTSPVTFRTRHSGILLGICGGRLNSDPIGNRPGGEMGCPHISRNGMKERFGSQSRGGHSVDENPAANRKGRRSNIG